MSNVTRETTADQEDSNDDYDEMELTLALPGESRERKLGTKRLFSDVVYLKPSDSECSESDYSRKHVSKERVVGWPPVRSYRKNTTKSRNCKYVKVAVDGAPYLRKVNLESYTSYKQLLCAFEDMISCFTIMNEKMTDHVNRSEHVPTYEDKDGDWMLVGDVPWKMFVETCKRIRLMKSSEAFNKLDARALLKS